MVTEAYERYRSNDSGARRRLHPRAGERIAGPVRHLRGRVRGRSFEIGDVDVHFSIQSVSKPFVFALVCDTVGYEAARLRLGVNSTGFPFNSLMAVELNDERTMNPLVNAGAIATTSLVPGATAEEKWESIRERLSRFAGRELTINEEVYASESATNMRNHGIAHLLESYERLYFDADEATDIYTRQCSLDVTAHDLAVMAATLANGGVNPVTGETVIGPGRVPESAGRDGERRALRAVGRLAVRDRGARQERRQWRHRDGLPGQGRVGDVLAAPGRRPATASAASSSTKDLAERLGLNLFASVPAEGPPPEFTSRRRWASRPAPRGSARTTYCARMPSM